MPAGRPTKYKPEYCDAIVAFIAAGGDPVLKCPAVGPAVEVGRLPAYITAFARHIDVSMDTLNEWCKTHPEFSDAYKKAQTIQLEQMVNGAMTGAYVPSMTIFALKNMHGWRDKSEVMGDGGGALEIVLRDYVSAKKVGNGKG